MERAIEFEEFNCYKCGKNEYKVDRPTKFIDPYALDFKCLNCGNKFILDIDMNGE